MLNVCLSTTFTTTCWIPAGYVNLCTRSSKLQETERNQQTAACKVIVDLDIPKKLISLASGIDGSFQNVYLHDVPSLSDVVSW